MITMTINVTPITADDLQVLEGVVTARGRFTRAHDAPGQRPIMLAWFNEDGDLVYKNTEALAEAATDLAIERAVAGALELKRRELDAQHGDERYARYCAKDRARNR